MRQDFCIHPAKMLLVLEITLRHTRLLIIGVQIVQLIQVEV